MKKILRKSMVPVTLLAAALLLGGCGTYSVTTTNTQPYYDYSYSNPAWAPTYYSGARYYYLPDIECYYDLTTRDFVMLNGGRWVFVPSVVPFYPTFDLYSSYVVVVNINVYQPWMHHQYYNSHYPRYYYIDYYDYSNIPYVRGYNENQKGAIYWPENDRSKARPWNDRNIRDNRKFTYSSADRRVQQETTQRVNRERAAASTSNDRTSTSTTNRTPTNDRNSTVSRTDNTTTDRNSTTSRTNSTTTDRQTRESATTTDRNTSASTTNRTATTESRESTQDRTQTSTTRSSDTNYYGQPIGTPVKVERQMRNTESSTSTRSGENTNSRSSSSSTSSSRNSSSSTSGRR